ncbi:MAG: hypothetical protein Q7R46_00345 [bacterium]|nr:hypothetical protein [bacterium]
MIPIVSIFNLISALFFVGITLKLYFSYRKNKDEKMGDFFRTFLFLSIVLILLSSPGIILKKSEAIGLVFSLYTFFVFFGIAYLSIIPLNILGWMKMKRIFFGGMIGSAFLLTFINLIRLSPARIFYDAPFIYWEDTRGVLMNIILGAIFGLSLLMSIIFFLIQGFKSSERLVKIRSILIAGGLLNLTLASIVNFVVGALAGIYVTSLVATIFNISAGLLILAGIYYKSSPVQDGLDK